MKRLLIVMLMVLLAVSATAQVYETRGDVQYPNLGMTDLEFIQGFYVPLSGVLLQDGSAFTNISDKSAVFMYAPSATNTEGFVMVTNSSVETATGSFLFDIPTTQTDTNGVFWFMVKFLTADDEPFFAGTGTLTIVESTAGGSPGSIDLTKPLNWQGYSYLNPTSGPVLIGTGITSTTNSLGQLVFSVASGGTVTTSGSPVSNDFARFVTATAIEGLSNGEVRTALSLVIGTDVQAWAAVLDNTTASYTTAEETKLSGIETAADVTDTTNVTAAGALMDSEVDADIKTFALPASTTISTYGATLVDDTNAVAARVTLGVVIGSAVQAWSSILDGMTAIYTTAQSNKLAGVEALADVTDAGNVGAAGAFDAANQTNRPVELYFNISNTNADYEVAIAGDWPSTFTLTDARFYTGGGTGVIHLCEASTNEGFRAYTVTNNVLAVTAAWTIDSSWDDDSIAVGSVLKVVVINGTFTNAYIRVRGTY